MADDVQKKTIPHPDEMNGDHGRAFDLLIEQYKGGHYKFELLGAPVEIGSPDKGVVYVVKRSDTNPDQAAEPHGL